MKQKDAAREYRKFIEAWLPKFTERCTIFLLNLKDRRAIKEEDWEVIKTAFRSYYMGYCPDFVPAWQPPQERAKQTDIFDSVECDTSDKSAEDIAKKDIGMDFDVLLPELNITDDDDKEV